ncbi:MAG: uncharacterized protein A8A55_3487, partial [Amphiamblys sp. WSBS2006]
MVAMDQEKFLSDFLSGCTEAAGIREEALAEALKYTAAELSAFFYRRGEEMETAEKFVALEHAAKKYTFALAAKEAWEEIPSFQRMVPFSPFSAGDNPEIMKNLFAMVSDLMKKVSEPSERELQVSFSRLLCFLSVEESDIKQFVDLADLEDDIMVQEDFVFVEIKKNEEFTVPRPVQEEEKAVDKSGGGEEAKRRENQPLVAE